MNPQLFLLIALINTANTQNNCDIKCNNIDYINIQFKQHQGREHGDEYIINISDYVLIGEYLYNYNISEFECSQLCLNKPKYIFLYNNDKYNVKDITYYQIEPTISTTSKTTITPSKTTSTSSKTTTSISTSTTTSITTPTTSISTSTTTSITTPTTSKTTSTTTPTTSISTSSISTSTTSISTTSLFSSTVTPPRNQSNEIAQYNYKLLVPIDGSLLLISILINFFCCYYYKKLSNDNKTYLDQIIKLEEENNNLDVRTIYSNPVYEESKLDYTPYIMGRNTVYGF